MSGKRYAVLVAASNFPDDEKLTDLRCPDNDVAGFNEVLTSEAHGKFSDTVVLKNEPHFEVLRHVNRVLKNADKDDLVLIYYSGHGKLDGAGRLHLATSRTA